MSKDVNISSEERKPNEAGQWLSRIKHASDVEHKWRKTARDVESICRGEGAGSKGGAAKTKFNILYSNTQTLKAAIYQRTPKPDVRRRYRDENPVAREVSEVIERALSFSLDAYDFDGSVRAAVDDYLKAGRGVIRVVYTPVMNEVTPEPIYNEEAGEFEEQEPYEELVYEEVTCKYWPWEDLRVCPAKRWDDAGWIAFRHFMDKEEVKDNFGEEAVEKVPLTSRLSQTDDDGDNKEYSDVFKRAEVWEVWDKQTRTVYFVCAGCEDILKKVEDPYGLKDFFPIPRPMYSSEMNDSLVPVCEYQIYEDLVNELEVLTKRITKLSKALKLVGVYDGANKELEDLLSSPDNTMVPSTNFTMLQEKGGLRQSVQFLPMVEIAQVLAQLYINREQVKQAIYEITGVSDIMRGTSKASETATAQRIKGNFGTLRIQDRQQEVFRFVRDLIRIKAELIAEKFSPDTLQLQTGKEVTDEMQNIMQQDILREYAIDIETDSTVMADAGEEQRSATELLMAVGQYTQMMMPLVQAGLPMEPFKEILLIAVRKFKGARNFEEQLEEAFTAPQQPQIEQQQQEVTMDGIPGRPS